MIWRLIHAARYLRCYLLHTDSTTRTRWGAFCPTCGVQWDLYW